MKRQRPNLATAAALVLLAALLPVSASAATVHSGGSVSIGGGETLVGNAYVAGASVDVAATSAGDLVILGYGARASGPVAGDLTVVSGSASVDSPVAGDLRVLSGFVMVNAEVAGDVVVVGGEVTLSDRAKIGGDLVAVGGAVSFDGDVAGAAKVVAGDVWINGRLASGGEVTAARKISFGARASVGAAVSYFSPNDAWLAPEASSLGSSLRHNRIPSISETGLAKRAALQFLAFWHLLSFISNLLIGLAIAYGARVFAADLARECRARPGRSVLAGVGVFVFLPVVAVMAVASLFALPVGALAFLATAAAAILAAPLSAIALGRIVLSTRGEPSWGIGFREVAVGSVILALVGLIPQVGFAIKLVLSLVAVGAAVRVLMARARGPSPILEALQGLRRESHESHGETVAGPKS